MVATGCRKRPEPLIPFIFFRITSLNCGGGRSTDETGQRTTHIKFSKLFGTCKGSLILSYVGDS